MVAAVYDYRFRAASNEVFEVLVENFQRFSTIFLTGIASRGKLYLASRNRLLITVESLGAGRQVEANAIDN